MKSGPIVGGPVARTMKITGSTNMAVGALTAAVTINGMIGLQVLDSFGQAVLLGVIFLSVAAVSAAFSADLFRRSLQAIANLRSMGASTGSISSAVFGNFLVYGAAGSILGSAMGAALGASLVGTSLGAGTVFEVLGAIAASAAATAAGVYAGRRASWSR
jgi:predicted lysophospholipase L1 biosynthesis ABC-type transport system permease subunit